MDHIQSRESDFEIDLESGGTTSDEDYVSNNCDLDGENSSNELYKAGSGILGVQSCNGPERKEDDSNTNKMMLNADELSVRCTEIWSNRVREEMEKLGDNKMDIRKTRKPKPAKPPRPPKGPSLDACDVKLVKEISELAIWKRRRAERVNALNKIKRESGSSSRMNILATVITILFFLVILFQGRLYHATTSCFLLQVKNASIGFVTFNKEAHLIIYHIYSVPVLSLFTKVLLVDLKCKQVCFIILEDSPAQETEETKRTER